MSQKNHHRNQSEADELFQKFMSEAPKSSRNPEFSTLRFDQQLLFQLRNNIRRSQNRKARLLQSARIQDNNTNEQLLGINLTGISTTKNAFSQRLTPV